MKIGIITLHYNLNYGAVLQAFALQKKLNEMGYDAELINFVNPMAKNNMKLFGGRIKDKARALLYLGKRIKRIKAFKKFIFEEYKLSKEITEPKDLTVDNLKYDLFIVGSDQTFNLYLAGGKKLRETYFLPLVKENKISYASSMGDGISKYTKDDEQWLKDILSEYKILSVREKEAADFIESLGITRPQLVLDPTLLLSDKQWENISKETNYKPNSYILFYSVLSSEWIVKAVENISEKLGLKVLAPHFKNNLELKTNFIRAEECGPKEFISLVKNAAFVCTSSFHGTVFSILFKKKFLAFSSSKGGRIENILKKLSLEELLVKEQDNIIEKLGKTKNIDFCNAHSVLENERQASTDFLKSAVD